MRDCVKLDRDGTCSIITEGDRAKYQKKITSQTEEFSSTDFRGWLNLDYDRIHINEHGVWNKDPANMITWACSFPEESKVNCYIESAGIRTYSGVLEKIAG